MHFYNHKSYQIFKNIKRKVIFRVEVIIIFLYHGVLIGMQSVKFPHIFEEQL